MFDYPSVLMLAALVVLFVLLAMRARRSRRPALRWLGGGLAGLMALAAFALLGGAVYGYWMINHDRENPVPDLQVALTPERIERGARFRPYCTSCHAATIDESPTGKNFLAEESGAPPIGRFWAPNLTPIQLGNWTDGEIARAIREGIHRNGRGLLIMPSQLLRHLSDEDLASIIAWLRALPEEGEPTAPNRLNALGALMVPHIDILRDQAHIAEPVPHPSIGPTAEYGAYLWSLSCSLCHGTDAMGLPDWEGPALVHIPLVYTEAQFIELIRSGQRPDGSRLDGEKMPWEDISRIFADDDDLRAIYARLSQLGSDSD